MEALEEGERYLEGLRRAVDGLRNHRAAEPEDGRATPGSDADTEGPESPEDRNWVPTTMVKVRRRSRLPVHRTVAQCARP